MPMMTDIQAYLIAQGLGDEDDIFYGNMPDTPDVCTCIYQYAGRPADEVVDVEYPGLQVRCRSTTSMGAYARANEAFITLHGLTMETITVDGVSTLYYHISANSSPEHLGKDDAGRYEFVVNFAVVKAREAI